MTLPNERLNALRNAQEFLRSLLDSSKTPGIPKHIRTQAYYCLKHFPESYYTDSFANMGKMVEDGIKYEKRFPK